MFQFPGFPACNYFIHCTLPDSSSGGLPHSEIRGSVLIYSSPRLFAVSHVLLRLPVPRHSPYALFRLNFFCSLLRSISYQFKGYFISPFCKIVYPLRKNQNFFSFSFSVRFSFLLFIRFSKIFSRKSFRSRGCQHRPIFPSSLPLSIVGTQQLNFRVRYGYGWTLFV